MTSNAYLEPLARDDVPELEPAFAMTEAHLGFLPNDVLTMARLPGPTAAFMEFCITVYAEATLPQPLLHLVSLVASAASGCRYCTAHTANKSHDDGVDAQKVAAVWEFQSSPLFDEAERAALDFAFKAAQSPSALEQDDYTAMAEHYTETEVTELLLVVCQMGFWNRWNDTVATELERPPLDFSRSSLPASRWDAGKHA